MALEWISDYAVGMTDPVALAVATAALEKGVELAVASIAEVVSAQFKSAVKAWSSRPAIGTATERLDAVRLVKTIWQLDKAVDLFDFYYPAKLEISPGQRRITVEELGDIPADGNIVVQGIVGQGKSIFLRFLTCREAVDGKRLPLFIELRRLRNDERLEHYILQELTALGLQCDRELLLELAEGGFLALFLDAFDEVREDRRGALLHEIEELARQCPKLRILVTTRPDAGIEKSPAFEVFALSPLRDNEYEAVIQRICHDDSTAEVIVRGMQASGRRIQALLTTPLMVALLVLRHRADQSIPENHAAFFSDLFALLLQRHDKMKAGYVRTRKSKLGDRALEKIFISICYLTRKRGESAFSSSAMYELTRQALGMADLAADIDAVLDDISEITCLLLSEGGEYRFVHKSVQEYHAACFVERQPDEIAIKFYSAMLPRWFAWEEELKFLETLDGYRCRKWFILPMLGQFLERPLEELPTSVLDLFWVQLRNEQSLPRGVLILMRSHDDHAWISHRLVTQGYSLSGLSQIAKRVAQAEQESELADLCLSDIAVGHSCYDELIAEAGKIVSAVQRDFEAAKRAVEIVEKQKSLMDF